MGRVETLKRAGTRARIAAALLAIVGFCCGTARAETCTTQSGLADADRNSIAYAARTTAAKVQANDAAALRASSIPEITKDFGLLESLIAATAPKLAGGVIVVEQVYLLDASTLKRNADGSAPDAQFFCSLNRSSMEAEFVIPALPPGKYAFAIATVTAPTGAAKPAPWRLSFLMRQDSPGKWSLAGFYPRAMTAAGHDGLWYWTQAREMAKQKQPWDAWLYYQAAQTLLQPAPFVVSTHLDKLRTEATAAAPPALSEGVSVDAPLVVKAADGTEYRFTGLGVDDSLGQSSLDIAVHLRVDPSDTAKSDPSAARKRNDAAAAALLAAYPELRKPFHGVWVYAETPGQNPFATEQPMAEIK